MISPPMIIPSMIIPSMIIPNEGGFPRPPRRPSPPGAR